MGRYSEEALYAACLDWMYDSSEQHLDQGGIVRVEATQVEEIRASTAMFDAMDRQFGGEHARRLAVHYLGETVGPRLRGSYTQAVGRDLFSAASVLCELIGWMAYDSERHSLAQRYFIQALRMATAAGDRSYGTYVLTTMGHQALYLKRADQALRLAKAAVDKSEGLGIPGLQVECLALEARAYSQLGDSRGCSDALDSAERAVGNPCAGSRPSWLAHWDDAVFGSYAGDCWLDLKNATKAESFLLMAKKNASGQRRREAYINSRLASCALLDDKHHKDPDYAAELGIQAIEAASGLTSARSLQAIRDLRSLLKDYADRPHVRDFEDRAHYLLEKGPKVA